MIEMIALITLMTATTVAISSMIHTRLKRIEEREGIYFEYFRNRDLQRRKKMKKAMISQPMSGLTDEQIEETRNRAITYLESRGYEVVDTLFTDEWYSPKYMEKRGVKNIPLCFLAKSIENMCLCDAVYFCRGWENARGCKIEHTAALDYGIEMLYEREE